MIIANISGKRDVVTFVITAKKMLAEFYETNDSSSNDIEEPKQRIIETADKVIKNDFRRIIMGRVGHKFAK